jgi:hypothetical protein
MHNSYRNGKTLNGKRRFLFNAFFFLPLFLFAQYDFNANCRETYQSILSLKFQDAAMHLQEEKKVHPSNLIPVYLENYTDFLKVFIGEDPAVYEKFRQTYKTRLILQENGNKESPWFRYCIGNMRIQLAICKIKFGEYNTAAIEISRAYSDLKENEKLNPGFLPQNSGLGLIHVLAGIIPEKYAWILKILGLEGNVSAGLTELSLLAGYSGNNETFQLLRLESLFYLAFLDATLGKDAKNALLILRKYEGQKNSFPGPGNPLIAFVRASILSRSGMTDEAIENLQKVHPEEGDFPFCYLDYLTGLNKLNRLDPDADLYFIRYIKNFRGRNYIKSAYQKLAWTFLLKGNEAKYREYIGKITARGALLIDSDIQANSEAKSGSWPNPLLLKARLLSDGGYTDQALRMLQDPDAKSDLKTPKELIEYDYRLGRLCQQAEKYREALDYFGITIREGRGQPWYFAANAALQSGLIHEHNKDYADAERYFRLCLSMKNSEYKNSLDQKARLGLKRIKPYLP